MKKFISILSLTLSLGAYAADRVETLDPALYSRENATAATHELPLHIAHFANVKWTRDEIVAQVRHLAEVYKQCSIRVGTVKVYHIESETMPPIAFSNPQMPEFGYQTVADKLSITSRPLVFLFDSAAKDEHESSFAVARWKIFPEMKVADSVANTVWLLHAINSPEYDKKHHPKCENCVLPHELGHALLRDPQHNGDNPPNLMSGSRLGGRTRTLTPELCAEFKDSPLLQAISH